MILSRIGVVGQVWALWRVGVDICKHLGKHDVSTAAQVFPHAYSAGMSAHRTAAKSYPAVPDAIVVVVESPISKNYPT
jgi:hypothetical protein